MSGIHTYPGIHIPGIYSTRKRPLTASSGLLFFSYFFINVTKVKGCTWSRTKSELPRMLFTDDHERRRLPKMVRSTSIKIRSSRGTIL